MNIEREISLLKLQVADALRKITAKTTSWGAVAGSIKNQKDLTKELDLKQDLSKKAKNFSLINHVLYPTVQAVKENTLSKNEADYPSATLPLDDADQIVIFQGGVSKKVSKSELGGGAVSEYLIPRYFWHNWTQAGQTFHNPFSPESANVNVRMEAPGVGDGFTISAVFDEPVLISKIYYTCGSLNSYGSVTNVKGFKLLGHATAPVLANANSGSFPVVLHNTGVGHAEMQPNTTMEDWFTLKEITVANPQMVRSIAFHAISMWSGTRPTIVRLLFK